MLLAFIRFFSKYFKIDQSMNTEGQIIEPTVNTDKYDLLNPGKFESLSHRKFVLGQGLENNQNINKKAQQVSMKQDYIWESQALVDLKQMKTSCLEILSRLQKLQKGSFQINNRRNIQDAGILKCIGQKIAQANSVLERLLQIKIMRRNEAGRESPSHQIYEKGTSKTYPDSRQSENKLNQPPKECKVSPFEAQIGYENQSTITISQYEEELSIYRLPEKERLQQGLDKQKSSIQPSEIIFFQVTQTQKSSDSDSSSEFQLFYCSTVETYPPLKNLLQLI